MLRIKLPAARCGKVRVQPDRQRIFNVPLVLVILVGLMLGIHLLRQLLPLEQDIWTLIHFGFVPGRFTYAFRSRPDRKSHRRGARRRSDAGRDRPRFSQQRQAAVVDAAHLCFPPCQLGACGLQFALARGFRRAGRAALRPQRFIAFCIGGAVAGALAHLVTHLNDLQPVIGASAVDVGDDGGSGALHVSAGRAAGRASAGRSAAERPHMRDRRCRSSRSSPTAAR